MRLNKIINSLYLAIISLNNKQQFILKVLIFPASLSISKRYWRREKNGNEIVKYGFLRRIRVKNQLKGRGSTGFKLPLKSFTDYATDFMSPPWQHTDHFSQPLYDNLPNNFLITSLSSFWLPSSDTLWHSPFPSDFLLNNSIIPQT